MSNENLIVAVLLPLLVFLFMQFAEKSKRYLKWLYLLIFVEYTFLLLFFAVISRNTLADYYIQAELFWGYRNPAKYIFEDNIINIIVFIPVGILSGLVFRRLFVIKSLFAGMLISETIECLQLIYKRGTFDVDDLFNNTLGAVIGSIVYVIVTKTWKMLKLHYSSN